MTARWISVSRAPTASRSRSNESHSSRLLAATDIGAVFCRDVVRQFQSGWQNVSGVEHPAAQPQLHRPMPVESRSGQQDFGRIAMPTRPRQAQCE
jgi:hypothetical protein